MVKKKSRPRKRTLGTRFKEQPISTLTTEAKKLGIPKPISKLILLGLVASFALPQTAPFLNKIPGMNIFTGMGASARKRLLSMR